MGRWDGMPDPLRLLFSLVIALFVSAIAADAQATNAALLPEDIYGATIRIGASPDAAHPAGTLFMVEGPPKGEVVLVEWDIAHAVVFRRIPLGMRTSEWASHVVAAPTNPGCETTLHAFGHTIVLTETRQLRTRITWH